MSKMSPTGRLHRSEPNLQNIPIRTELGRRIREAFVPRIIERGTAPSEQVAKHRCDTCKSLVEYEKSDIQGDQRDGDYVKCPVCGAFISIKVLNWENKT